MLSMWKVCAVCKVKVYLCSLVSVCELCGICLVWIICVYVVYEIGMMWDEIYFVYIMRYVLAWGISVCGMFRICVPMSHRQLWSHQGFLFKSLGTKRNTTPTFTNSFHCIKSLALGASKVTACHQTWEWPESTHWDAHGGRTDSAQCPLKTHRVWRVYVSKGCTATSQPMISEKTAKETIIRNDSHELTGCEFHLSLHCSHM